MKELFATFTPEKPLHFFCLDQDKEALAFSRNALEGLPSGITVDFIAENILSMTKESCYKERLNKQDIVYSIGLIDWFYHPHVYGTLTIIRGSSTLFAIILAIISRFDIGKRYAKALGIVAILSVFLGIVAMIRNVGGYLRIMPV